MCKKVEQNYISKLKNRKKSDEKWTELDLNWVSATSLFLHDEVMNNS